MMTILVNLAGMMDEFDSVQLHASCGQLDRGELHKGITLLNVQVDLHNRISVCLHGIKSLLHNFIEICVNFLFSCFGRNAAGVYSARMSREQSRRTICVKLPKKSTINKTQSNGNKFRRITLLINKNKNSKKSNINKSQINNNSKSNKVALKIKERKKNLMI